jgi:hypothetical protein
VIFFLDIPVHAAYLTFGTLKGALDAGPDVMRLRNKQYIHFTGETDRTAFGLAMG